MYICCCCILLLFVLPLMVNKVVYILTILEILHIIMPNDGVPLKSGLGVVKVIENGADR